MATYYIRKTGSDSNAGTSAGAAWLTLGKALGAAGISSGDTVYIGAGIYRETVTVNMTSAVAETSIIGDVDGSKTGDAGEVILSSWTNGDRSVGSGSNLLTLNGRDFLTFQKITFNAYANAVSATITTSTNITIKDCVFLPCVNSGAIQVQAVNTFGVAYNWLIQRCVFVGLPANPIIKITLVTGSGSDYDSNFIVENSVFFIFANEAIGVVSTGAGAQEGGGVIARNCFAIGRLNFFTTTGTQIGGSAFTYPCKVQNCNMFTASAPVSAGELGAIVEDYNIFWSNSARVNVTAGAHSIIDFSNNPLVEIGQSFIYGMTPRPFFSPLPTAGLLGWGNDTGAPTVDLLSYPRPNGEIVKGDTGTATAGGAKTLTDSGKAWGTNYWAYYTVKIISGTGSGQTKTIASNTATVLTVDGNWKTNPDATSVYMIYQGCMSSSGTATAGTTTSLTDANAAWPTNTWAGYVLKIDGGTGSPQTLTVTSNTATVLSFATATAPDNTSTYKLYRKTDENTINPSCGAFEVPNTAIKDTGTVRTGTNSIRLQGAGTFDLSIPVDAVSTVVSVWVQWDAAYSGTKPQLKAFNGTEAGVADATATAVGSASAWEQLSLTIVPTSKGVVSFRFQSNSTTPTGTAFWDDFLVT